jgi:hypothetical protein
MKKKGKRKKKGRMVAYQIHEVENGRTPFRELAFENISASSKSMKTQQFQLPLRRKRRACILDTHDNNNNIGLI